MSSLSDLIHDGSVAAGAAGVIYAATVTAAALTALTARTATRRRDAQAVLKILLRRREQ